VLPHPHLAVGGAAVVRSMQSRRLPHNGSSATPPPTAAWMSSEQSWNVGEVQAAWGQSQG
jgi:hypothetical protein